MQSYDDAPMNVSKKLSIAERTCQGKGKENCVTSSACLPPSQQKQTVQNTEPKGPMKSKLPVLSKTMAPPDFQKMHQSWQSHFQRGKAVCKKSCTRPQPFNFSQRGARPRVKVPDVSNSGASLSGQPLCNSQASHKIREPLTNVALGQNKKESSVVKGGSEVDFKADPAALASILSNIGVSTAPVGKVSLAQRVPMRASSIAHPLNSSKNTMIRSSMYTVPTCQPGPSNMGRMSCVPKMTVKAYEQKPLFRTQNRNPVTETSVKEPGGLKKDELHPQENPVLQQMNPNPHVATSDKTSCSLATQDTLTKLTSLPAKTDETSTVLSAQQCETSSTEVNGTAGKKDFIKNTDTCSVDFVADSQALASILSNTEMNITNFRKISLAQRVPMQGRSSMFKGAMALSGTLLTQTASPKPACGTKSNVTVPLKELMFSPCRVPLVTSDKNSGGSARRVLQSQSTTMKFSQLYSVTHKQPVFPKTPRALALEKANKCLESEKSNVQTSSKSIVKWADEMSPSSLSEVLGVQETDMKEVAMRLFLDGEGAGDSEKKKEPTAVSDPLIVLGCLPTKAPQHQELVQPAGANVGDSLNFQLHSQMHLAPSLQPNASDSSSSVVTGIKSSVPLSFLAHPAVKALQCCTLGPSSLPDIARLRLQAAVSAKQRFWESRLDEECAFYTTRCVSGSIRSCTDPVSIFLDKQEDMHFTPICPGES
ncbi:tastin [Rana temporaria]|uniref:tastin n=1 Tax=Rana temporaria TaxID=8407 RepID=UPI001AAC8FC3|nr:tastin [Rana temporaria]XP_040197092.1 tastin [Rana temporaria]